MFHDKVLELIKKNQKNQEKKYDEVVDEVLIHFRYARELVNRFVERKDVLEKVWILSLYRHL